MSRKMSQAQANEVARGNLDAYFKTTKPNGPLAYKTGDRVTYARYFLKATGEPATGERWFSRGVLAETPHPTLDDRFAMVHWDGHPAAVAVNTCNLALDPRHHGMNMRHAE